MTFLIYLVQGYLPAFRGCSTAWGSQGDFSVVIYIFGISVSFSYWPLWVQSMKPMNSVQAQFLNMFVLHCSGKHRHPTPHLCSRTYVSSSFSHLSSFPLFSLTVFVKRGGNLTKTGRLSREPMADSKREAFDLGVRGCTLRYCWSAHPEACLSSSQADTMQHQRGGRRKGREGGG